MRGNLREFGVRGRLEARRAVLPVEGCGIALLLESGEFGFPRASWRYLAVVRAARPAGMKRLAAVGTGVR